MNRFFLFSDVDYFILGFIAIAVVVFLFNWIGNKLRSKNNEYVDFSDTEVDLSNYMLNFDVIPIRSKAIKFSSKFILFALALAIIFIPLYEFITKLTPETVYYGYILF